MSAPGSERMPASMFAPARWPLWFGLGLLYLIGRLPARLRLALGGSIGERLLQRSAKRMEIVDTNLKWCFPEFGEGERSVLMSRFGRWLGRSYLELGHFWWGSARRYQRRIEFEGLEHVETLLAADKPVIIVTAHSTAMDIGGVALSLKLPLTTFANNLRDPLLDWWVANRRGRFGCHIFRRSGGIRPVVKEVKAGRVLFFPADEDQGGKQSDTVFARFFGVQKSTLTSPLRLARMCGAAVLPATTYYDEAIGKYRVKIYPPLDYPEKDLQAGAQALNHAFEVAIREAPAQYLWSQRLFTTRPDGAPAPYTMKGYPDTGPRPRPED